jgi:hypothetical protein
MGVVTKPQHIYEVRPRKDERGVDLISDALPFGRLRYGGPNAMNSDVLDLPHTGTIVITNRLYFQSRPSA